MSNPDHPTEAASAGKASRPSLTAHAKAVAKILREREAGIRQRVMQADSKIEQLSLGLECCQSELRRLRARVGADEEQIANSRLQMSECFGLLKVADDQFIEARAELIQTKTALVESSEEVRRLSRLVAAREEASAAALRQMDQEIRAGKDQLKDAHGKIAELQSAQAIDRERLAAAAEALQGRDDGLSILKRELARAIEDKLELATLQTELEATLKRFRTALAEAKASRALHKQARLKLAEDHRRILGELNALKHSPFGILARWTSHLLKPSGGPPGPRGRHES